MPKCKINGKEVEVAEGATIIEAYKKSGTDIAHYCYHEGLSVAGVCRLCMVDIKDNPRMQIACNTTVQEGMEITNHSDRVKETVQWGLDFHLINHPLDCPVCDQAGECELQIQYMKFGQYDPEMAEPKVKKHKVVSLGDKVVLDSERCILCSRCVRFTTEITKTNELGIFNRGDRSEIGTFKGTPLNNKYSINTVDICPVGALTSKDFRFKQRVWYLKNNESVCQGCSTGCKVKIYHNEDGLFRVKPQFNPDNNGYWMCDEGRDVYKFVNPEFRLKKAVIKDASGLEEVDAGIAAKKMADKLKSIGGSKTAVILTGQYTTEEYHSFIGDLKEAGVSQFFHWKNNESSFNDFDDMLLRGDKNPNTKGLENKLAEVSGKSLKDFSAQNFDLVIVAGPENQTHFPEQKQIIASLDKAKEVIWLSSGLVEDLKTLSANYAHIPLKTFVEKQGHFINQKGQNQSIQNFITIIKGALTLSEVGSLLVGKQYALNAEGFLNKQMKTNYFTNTRGQL